jgi:methylglutaconyl-CoA hydratase
MLATFSAGGTQRLPRLIGAAKAKELIFTSASLSAQSAYDYGKFILTCENKADGFTNAQLYLLNKGIVNYATEDSSYPKALSLAQSMLLQGPIAMRMAKQAIDKGLQTDM